MSHNLIEKIYNIGTEKVSQPRLQRKVRLLNQITFISCLLTVIFLMTIYLYQTGEKNHLHWLTLVPLLIIFFSNAKGWINFSRFFLLLGLLFIITFYTLTPTNTGSIYYFFSLVISLFAIFYLDEWKKFAPLIVLEIGVLVFIMLTDFQFPFRVTPSSPFIEAYGETIGMVSAFLASVGILFYLIYENHKAERSLKFERNNLNSILASTDEGIWLIKDDYTLLIFNNAYQQWIKSATGISIENGMNLVEALKDYEEQIAVKHYMDKVLATGQSISFEKFFQVGDFEICLEISANPVIEKGRVVAVAWFGKDITERKRMEKALKEAKNQAEDSAETKARFLSNMSHELRTPLNAISGLTQIMEQEDLDAQNRKNLKNIRVSADQLLALINNILDFSKIESGERKYKEKQFNPFELFEQIESTFAYKAAQTGIDFQVNVDKNIPEVLVGDSTVLIQVLNNLVANAFKYCNKGFIRVDLQKEEAKEKDGKILLKGVVQDSGIGIPADKQADIFEPFKQVEDQESRKYEGSGLGLSICKRLLEGLNGTIGFESEEGKGSTFYFRMPLEVGKAAHATKQAQANSEESKNHIRDAKILLVEDNEMNRTVGLQMLKKLNTVPYTAEGGKEALALIEKESFDLILLDIHMPDMDGFEVALRTRQMENEGKIPYVPIIVMSADVFSSTKQRARETGIEDFIEKPINLEELESKIAVNCRVKE